jgi:hypothetical protein
VSTFEFIRNSLGLVAFLVVLYYVVQVIVHFSDARSARMLAPFAPVISAVAEPGKPFLVGYYAGHKVRLTFSPKMNVNSSTGETRSRINAFHVQILELPGKTDWWLKFHLSGLLGQGRKQLGIRAREAGLAERIRLSGVVEEVERVTNPSDTYIAVSYESFFKTLTYTDDVSPRKIPSEADLLKQLALAIRLATVNAQINA